VSGTAGYWRLRTGDRRSDCRTNRRCGRIPRGRSLGPAPSAGRCALNFRDAKDLHHLIVPSRGAHLDAQPHLHPLGTTDMSDVAALDVLDSRNHARHSNLGPVKAVYMKHSIEGAGPTTATQNYSHSANREQDHNPTPHLQRLFDRLGATAKLTNRGDYPLSQDGAIGSPRRPTGSSDACRGATSGHRARPGATGRGCPR